MPVAGSYKRRRTSRGLTSTKSFRKYAKNRRYRRRLAFGRRKGLARAVKNTILRMAESKILYANDAQNLTLEHNEVRVIRNNIFATVQGTDHTNRVGDKIFAKYIQFKMYFENQQYRPICDYLVLVLRNKNNASANLSDGENIFESVSTSKNLDYIDYNKYQVLYSKRVRVEASNLGTKNVMGNASVDGAAGVSTTGEWVFVNANRTFTFNLRLNKTIEYLDGTNIPSTMKYCLAVIPYSNYSSTTSGAVYPTGHVTVVSKFVFKDP